MIFSIIIPSYNQEKFIRKTLENVIELKKKASDAGIKIELLLFDNESNNKVRKIISEYASQIDFISIEKDKGQYDAINNGIIKATGTYWTWLNTDDLIDIDGFFKMAEILKNNPQIDYIYGTIEMIDEEDKVISYLQSKKLSFSRLINVSAGIFQPGSFFRREFTTKTNLLSNYECCFDYEYILQILKKNAVLYRCDFVVSKFRYYSFSKSGSITTKFIEEQLIISKSYGRKLFSLLTLILHLRKIKRKIFN